MKNAMPYIYMVMGFLVGFVVGAAPLETSGFPFQMFGYFLVAIVVIALYLWFEKTSHSRHLSKWQSHQRRGRLYFVLSHYIVARAIPILFVFIFPVSSRVHIAVDSVRVLIFTSAIALFAFALLGYQEWSTCQADFSVQSLKEAAQRAKETRSDFAGGGA